MSNRQLKNTVKIMLFGTFDGLHPGHLNFFKQARCLSEEKKCFLVISVARDRNVERLKGTLPSLNENKRFALISKSRLADKVVLSGIKNHLPHILKEKPDIIALGYDQKAYVPNLKKYLQNKGLRVKIVRLKPYLPKIFKNHLLRQRMISRTEKLR